MRKLKIEAFLSENTLKNLSEKQKSALSVGINSLKPILLTGGAGVGKTHIARELRMKGVVVYAPDMLCEINIETCEVKDE